MSQNPLEFLTVFITKFLLCSVKYIIDGVVYLIIDKLISSLFQLLMLFLSINLIIAF